MDLWTSFSKLLFYLDFVANFTSLLIFVELSFRICTAFCSQQQKRKTIRATMERCVGGWVGEWRVGMCFFV